MSNEYVDAKKLEKMFRESPGKLRNAVQHYLNDAAFAHRTSTIDVIKQVKTIRDARFVSSRVQVKKAVYGDPRGMFAISGSVRTNRFTGWTEDYSAKPTPRGSREIGKNARGGSMLDKAKNQNRLLKGMDLPKSSEFSDIPGTEGTRIMAMVSMIARHPSITQGSNGLFILNTGNWVPGVYRLKKGALAKIRQSSKRGKMRAANSTTYAPAIERVQKFVKSATFKRVPWAGMARAQSKGEIRALLSRDFQKYFMDKL